MAGEPTRWRGPKALAGAAAAGLALALACGTPPPGPGETGDGDVALSAAAGSGGAELATDGAYVGAGGMPRGADSRTRGDSIPALQETVEGKLRLRASDSMTVLLAPPAADPDPLVVVDGVVRRGDVDIDGLNRLDIATISVIRGREARERYGEQGAHGVILLTTKTGGS